MNLINKILFLVIILYLINYLTDGQILNTVKRYFFTCQEKMEHFMGITYTNKKGVYLNTPEIPYTVQKDFAYMNHNDIDNLDDESYHLYRFINNMVTPNFNIYELTSSRSKRIKADDNLVKEILQHLNRIFNTNKYRFNNIKLINDIYYYDNPRGKDIESFNFSANIAYKGKRMGTVIINIETFLREDKFFYKPMKTGFLSINNIRLLDRKYPNNKNNEKEWVSAYKINPKSPQHYSEYKLKVNNNKYSDSELSSASDKQNNNISKSEKKAVKYNNKLTTKINEEFNDLFVDIENFDDLFIKPDTNNINNENLTNDTDNSLIPSVVNLTSFD